MERYAEPRYGFSSHLRTAPSAPRLPLGATRGLNRSDGLFRVVPGVPRANCARTCSGATLFWVVQDSEDEMRFKPSPRACAQFVAIGGLLSMMRPAIAQVVPPSNSTAAWSIVSRLTAGQEVRVNMTTGQSLHGTVGAADATSITVLVAGHHRHIAHENVRQVSIVRDLDRWQHVVIGLAVGAVAGSVAVAVHCRGASASCKEVAPAYVLPGVGLGAAVGALLPKRKVWQEIYVRQ